MLNLIKLILYRIIHNKEFLIVYLVLIPIVIGFAVYFTNSVSYGMQIGVVGDVEVANNDEVKYIYLDQVPKNSELVLSQYDAVLVQEGQDTKVISTKGEEFNQALLMLVSGHIDTLQNDSGTIRGNATNIIGFLMMVILLLGTQIYQYYFYERGGIDKRILGTSVRCYQYMLSHFIVVLTFLFIPSVTVICGALFIFDITISIALWKFILTLFMLCFFTTAFGLWLNASTKSMEESLILENMFAIIGSIVSGGFVVVTNNEIFNRIVKVFPQKQIMSLLEALENNLTLPYLGIIYVIGLSVVFIVLGIIVEKRKLTTR